MHRPEVAQTAVKPLPNAKLSHTMFLIGDAGDAGLVEHDSVVNQLKLHLADAPSNSSVIFLGDNNYPSGVPPKSKKELRKAAETNLEAQLSSLDNFDGLKVFIPGNHDWDKYYLKGIKRQEKIIEGYLNNTPEDNWEDEPEDQSKLGNYFQPDNGCPGPEVIEIDENLVVIIIDSQWWLLNWDKESRINDGCEIKSRKALAELVADEVKDHKGKNIVIAMHHPLRSYGPHGGKYTFINHLFPVTIVSKNFYLPLPIVGSVLMAIRSAGVSRQDIGHPLYKELNDALLTAAEDVGELIFVAGHEHSLQYIKDEGHHFIVSGAGSKKSATAKGKNAPFTFGNMGFSKIEFYNDGSAWLEFWIPDASNPKGKEVFRQQLKGPLSKTKSEDVSQSFPEYDRQLNTAYEFPITTPVKPVKKAERFMLGEHYRKVYLEQHHFPVLDLATYKGGMTVIKKGGGKQTNSLRLATKDGKEYVMRSMTKDLSRSVPYPFNQMPLVTYLFQDNYLATHPFAPLVVPTLADAAKVYHANSEIFYVPKQPALGVHNDKFGSEIYIVEERASKSWPELASFGNAEKFINSFDLAEKTIKNHNHHIDQPWVARSRIFDLLIGDWDRHDDQWRWTVTKMDEKNKMYRPIPRDRDQAFSKYDGFVVKLLKPYNLFLRQLADYDEKINNYKWATNNTRFFDNNFINELTLDDWLKEAAFIQKNMTDEVITEAFSKLPEKVYDLTAEEIIRVLKNRRENLQEIAKGMYGQLAKKVAIYGSEKSEYFEVIRKPNGITEVGMYDSDKKGNKKEQLYHRIFKASETKEVYIYGLGNDDIFHISGQADNGLVVRVVGGQGKDEFIDESKIEGLGKKNKFYDSEKGNKLQLGTEGKNLTSNIAKNNIYDRFGNQYDENVFTPIPLLGFNPDDGFLIGASTSFKIHQFNKSPYGQLHKFGIQYAFATKAIDLDYTGEFLECFKRSDLIINAELRGGRYAFNFFGLGNETPRPVDDVEFYRVRQSMGYFDIGIQRRFASDIGRFSIRPLIQSADIKDSEDRFIDGDNTGLETKDFESRIYAGIAGAINIYQADNDISPRDGFGFNAEVMYRQNITGTDRQFTNINTDLSIYKALVPNKKLVLATRLGANFIRGNYDFFFAPTLGQQTNLRGLLRDRFRGPTTFFHTTDLRVDLASVNNPILPFTLGISGSFDYGRVWEQELSSKVWHTNFGGGIWLVPLNLIVVSVSYHKSSDDELLLVKLGHHF